MTDRFDHLFIAPRDFAASLAFYRDILGMEVTASWGGDGEPRGAMLRRGGVALVLAEPHDEKADHAWREGRRGHAPTLHLSVEGLSERFAEIPPGDHVRIAPEATHWGAEWFVLEDPDGNMIAFNEAK
ncbi:MAG TPA: VOC family protein [Aliidongia sp.]|nr:VOC family protein [Aliidongia sp.]